jgi:hypothetical protein
MQLPACGLLLLAAVRHAWKLFLLVGQSSRCYTAHLVQDEGNGGLHQHHKYSEGDEGASPAEGV